MKCGECGHKNKDGSKFCEGCGGRLSAKCLCSACGADNPPDAKFCEQCGAVVSEAPQVPVAPTPEPIVAHPTPKAVPPQAIPVAQPDPPPKKGGFGAGVIVGALFVAGAGGYIALHQSAQSMTSAPAVSAAPASPAVAKSVEPALAPAPVAGPSPSPETVVNEEPAQTLANLATPHLLAMVAGTKANNEAAITASVDAIMQLTLPARGNRKTARAANDAGLAALKNNSFDEAIGKFNEAVQADPADQEVMNNLGYALMMAGRLKEAKTAFRDALSLAPTRSSAWVNLALALAREGMSEDGFAAYMLAFKFSQNPQKTREFITKQSQEDADPQVRELAARALQAMGTP